MPDYKCRILYVDDHEDSAEMLKLVLADVDYEVESARTVKQALAMASRIEFDLYVVDKRLPDGSGLELVKQLNKLTPGIPSIVYTGDVYEVHREQAMAAGADAFVCKPDIETLIKTVHEFLSERECATASAA
ncbi:MAG: response regulator [Acidobacteriota bacterium]